mgnify:CR=1 FL=1
MNLILPIFSLFLLVLLQSVFYSKRRVESSETGIYKYLMLISNFNIVFNIIGIYIGYNSGNMPVLKFLNHLDLPLYYWWASLLFLYFISIDLRNKKKLSRVKKIVFCINILFTILTVFLPFKVVASSTEGYAIGLCVNFVYSICAVYILLSLIESVRITLKGYTKKAVPMFALICLGIIAAITQKNIPNLIVIPSIIVYIELIMFFTIENPDLKILEEYNKNKELVETSLEEKSNILFKITEDVRTPVKKIRLYSENALQSEKLEDAKDNISKISQISSYLISNIDDVLSISQIDKKNIKVYETSYDIYNLFSQIIYIVKSKLDKSVIFNYSISNTIPPKLNGDSSKLKQILCSLITNNSKENNTVDLDISYIIKNDVCRLIITLTNSKLNMSLDEINKILSSNVEMDDEKLADLENIYIDYYMIKKMLDLLNGTFLIKNDEYGTTFTVILNQLIEKNDSKNSAFKLAKEISNKKKILLLDDNYKELSNISSELKKNNFEVSSVMYAEDAIDKLISGEEYNIFLIDDEMIGINAVSLIKKIDELKLNNLVSVVMLDKSKESIKNHYVDDYSFADYLLKDEYKEEIKRLKEKYK